MCIRDRPEAARLEIDRALALNPRYLPALLNLGNLCEQAGEREAAQQAYAQVLALEPGHALALSRLPNLRRFSDPQDPLIAALARAIAAPGRLPADCADLGFGLGKALDEVGRYDEAFAAYAAANLASRAAGGAGLRYDKMAASNLVDRLIATFARPVVGCASSSTPTPPIFICGMFRSGSTLVEQVLSAHPGITAGGELDLLPALVRQHLAPAGDWAVLGDPAALAELARTYLAALAQRFPGATRLTDKRPDNFLHIGLIKTLFPDARIVFTRRQPMDNCLSLWFLHLGHSMPYALDLLDTAHWYRQHDRLMAHWQALYPQDIHCVDYDRFVAEPEPQTRRLLAFCGLPWHAGCLDFQQARQHVQTASLWQVRQPLYRHASGRWRHYARHLAPLRTALGLAPEA